MKVCESCGTEISTKDGENLCTKCESLEGTAYQRISRKRIKQEREDCYRSLGLIKCKGAMGGVWWE